MHWKAVIKTFPRIVALHIWLPDLLFPVASRFYVNWCCNFFPQNITIANHRLAGLYTNHPINHIGLLVELSIDPGMALGTSFFHHLEPS